MTHGQKRLQHVPRDLNTLGTLKSAHSIHNELYNSTHTHIGAYTCTQKKNPYSVPEKYLHLQ